MSRGPGRPARPISDEEMKQIEAHLDEGWPFQEITRTYGIDYRRLRRLFPGRQWTNRQAAQHGVTVRRLRNVERYTADNTHNKVVRLVSR